MKHILTLIGARPQFIKAAPVSKALAKQSISETLVHSGQHYDVKMSEVFFKGLDLPSPGHYLNIGSSSHGHQTGQCMERFEKICMDEKPNAILIYGDTNTTLAGALVGAKLCIPVVHVEAGLRSNNRAMPEEINRIVADRCSTLLFAPTHTAHDNLLSEGMSEESIHLVGDVMYDLVLHCADKLPEFPAILEKNHLNPKEYILCTIHRASNTDNSKQLKILLVSAKFSTVS